MKISWNAAANKVEPAELTFERRDKARVQMPEARRGIGTHHVKIALALDVIEMDALSM